METAAFVSSLSDYGLQELGRLAMNFGHIEMLLDGRIVQIADLAGAGRREMIKELIAPLATRRKLDIILRHLDRIANPEAREHVKTACDVVVAINDERNRILHGYWAFDTDDDPVGRSASKSNKKPDSSVPPEILTSIADQAAIATRHFVMALWAEAGIAARPFPIQLFAGKTPPKGWPLAGA